MLDQITTEKQVRQPLARCPVCDVEATSSTVRVLKRYKRDHVVQCANCSMRYSQLEPTQSDYDRVYGGYDYEGLESGHTPVSAAKESAIVDGLMGFRRTNKVLDIAAGFGRFLSHFKERGFDCYATEYDPGKRAALAAKAFHVLEGGTLPLYENDSFDIIILTETIGHINNPRPVIRNIAKLLRPGGAVYITTPNFDSVERYILREDWGMLMFPEHITYWSPAQLDRVLRDAGLVKKTLCTENISPFRLMQGFKKRKGQARDDAAATNVSDAAQAAVAGSRVLRAAKRMVNGLLSATNSGSSMIAVYVKPS